MSDRDRQVSTPREKSGAVEVQVTQHLELDQHAAPLPRRVGLVLCS
jgi:hypothetical protein